MLEKHMITSFKIFEVELPTEQSPLSFGPKTKDSKKGIKDLII